MEIGRGSYGVVHAFGVGLACKSFFNGQSGLHEYLVGRWLSHGPHLVIPLSYDPASQRMIMPRYQGNLLKTRLSVADRRRAMVAVIKAVAYIHSRGLVYLDARPENILIDTCPWRVGLADFSLASRYNPLDAQLDINDLVNLAWHLGLGQVPPQYTGDVSDLAVWFDCKLELPPPPTVIKRPILDERERVCLMIMSQALIEPDVDFYQPYYRRYPLAERDEADAVLWCCLSRPDLLWYIAPEAWELGQLQLLGFELPDS